jgi:anti-sigma B factor antagonist
MAGDEGLQAIGERRDDRYILKLVGKIDLSTVSQFEHALAQAGSASEPVVVIDLSGVEYIDSTGLTALMQSELAARSDPDRIQFLGRLQPEVEAVLRMSGVYDELQFIDPEKADR